MAKNQFRWAVELLSNVFLAKCENELKNYCDRQKLSYHRIYANFFLSQTIRWLPSTHLKQQHSLLLHCLEIYQEQVFAHVMNKSFHWRQFSGPSAFSHYCQVSQKFYVKKIIVFVWPLDQPKKSIVTKIETNWHIFSFSFALSDYGKKEIQCSMFDGKWKVVKFVFNLMASEFFHYWLMKSEHELSSEQSYEIDVR